MLQDGPTDGVSDVAQRTSVGLVIETERLTLRRPTMADAAALARLGNDRRISDMTRRLPFPYLLEHAAEFITALATAAESPQRETVYLIEHLHTPVGVVGINRRIADAPELGYWLGVDHWGQGFATEAARGAIDIAFEESGVDQMLASARVANPASRNILEKCGFQWTGVELHRFEALGSSSPVDCFRLTRSVWSSLKAWGPSTRREG